MSHVQPDLFDVPYTVLPHGQGTYLIKLGKPVVKETLIDTRTAAKILGRSPWTVYRYLVEGLLTGIQPKKRAKIRLIRAEVEALSRKTLAD